MVAGSFIPSSFNCNTGAESSFFTSANYAADSFSRSWSTLTIPDVEGNDDPVYLLVLQKFGISADFSNGTPPGGTLPGIDIKRMGAIDAIRLSLAEALTQGQWWDVYEDGEGGVYFQQVFNGGTAGKTITLDVRLCVATSSKDNEVDMVIVRGYNPPPQRFVREFRDVVPAGTGNINPTVVTGDERLFTVSPADLVGVDSCHASALANNATKSYKDPVTTDIDFGGQEPNPFYSVKAFEQLVGYVVDIDGMPNNPADAAKINISFSDSTIWYQEIDFPTFIETSEPSCGGLPTGNISYYEGIYSYQTPLFNDRYGTPWPLVIKPNGVYFTGNKLITVTQALNIASLYIEPAQGLLAISQGGDWTWDRPNPLEYDISIYYQPHADPDIWDNVLNATSSETLTRIIYSDGQPFVEELGESYTPTARDIKLLGNKDSLGYLVEKMWVAWELDRPSVQIEDQDGDAVGVAQNLRVRYAPIIVVDRDAPIAYYHKDEGGNIVDLTDGLQDKDPTTCQSFDESDIERMNNLAQGQVIDTTLPFCEDENVCLSVARTIFDYMTVDNVQQYTLTCGPDAEPELGAAVDGYDANLRIESITYSYSDSSSYTIEVTLGPIFANIGSWNAGAFIRKTEDVSRPAVIRWTAGDGVNYLVEVKGLGSFYAVNSVTDANGLFYPGDIVNVTIKNVPVEE